ncbi:hypothetical protein NXF25_019643 [Crotalus adamanteus]|uniref:Uncharacterized protein n=1 Tax=Crotalus adamanteus TaxID=8729 RepID=A0AAW1B4C2_CROAD
MVIAFWMSMPVTTPPG